MNTNEILQLLTQFYHQEQERYRIKRIGIFGSVARGEAKESSDVDVVVDLAEPRFQSLIGIKLALEDLLHRPVDIVRYRQSLSPFFKATLDQEAIYVQ